VCSGAGLDSYEIVDLLTQLVEKSLVYVEKSVEHGARYFMLESLWDYANEKLIEAGESDAYRIRHLDYFLKWAEDLRPKIMGAEQRQWLERMEPDDWNCRYAVEASLELPGQAAKGLRLLTAIARHIEVRGFFKDAREDFQKLLAHPENAARDAVRAHGLIAAGRMAWITDDLVVGEGYAREALGIFRELGDGCGTGQALMALALYVGDAGDLPQATALLGEAEPLATAAGDLRAMAMIGHGRANASSYQGDYAQALALDREALALLQRVGDLWTALLVEWCVAINATALGEFEEAHARFASAMTTGVALGNRWGVPYPLEGFAVLAFAQGQRARGARLLGAAEGLRARSGQAFQPADHPTFRNLLAAAQEELAKPECIAARAEGRELTLEEAMAMALRP
jgi:tetratricopeptide (TPR) repeat protein